MDNSTLAALASHVYAHLTGRHGETLTLALVRNTEGLYSGLYFVLRPEYAVGRPAVLFNVTYGDKPYEIIAAVKAAGVRFNAL